MRRRHPRQLRPDEVALWNKVVEKTEPLSPAPRSGNEWVSPENRPKPAPKPSPASIRPFRVGEQSRSQRPDHKLAPAIADHVASHPVAMDRKAFGKMKKGRLAPESRIDLHGMTTAQAHGALTRFILDKAAEGRRLVLVITGKGRLPQDDGPIPVRHGVLRHQVPHWLHTPPLKAHVLQIAEAHLKHGGQGAYYVYLRRNRQ